MQYLSITCPSLQDCTQAKHLAPGTGNAVKISRFFDKVGTIGTSYTLILHLKEPLYCRLSDRENYFWHAEQYVRHSFSALPDILSPVRHFLQLMTGKYQWSFLFSLLDILCVLNPAGQNVQQGLSSQSDIGTSLPDILCMFCDHCRLILCAYFCQYKRTVVSDSIPVN